MADDMDQDPEASSLAAEATDLSETAWERIANRLDAFAAAWQASLAQPHPAAPPLTEFLRDLPENETRFLALELIKVDLEHRWHHGRNPQRLEWYVAQVPLLVSVTRLPEELIYEEVQARIQAGDGVDDAELQRRFPQQAAAVGRLLGELAAPGSPTHTHPHDTEILPHPAKRPPVHAQPFLDLKPGEVIEDFQLLTTLGKGAFAHVFLARQLSMERLVALKVSRPVGSEHQTLAQLDHPHVVRVFDQRRTTTPPARLLYMEVVPGGTLADALARLRERAAATISGDDLLTAIDERLAAVGSMPPSGSERRGWIEEHSWSEIVCRLGAELAEGLAYAHARGVLHRDIKPANVLLTADGSPKLADFNVSYNGGRADEDPRDTFGGSLAYMSPEQLAACHPLLGGSPQLVREASDVYSLAVLLFESLVGKRPFADETVMASGGILVRLQRMIELRRQATPEQLQALLPRDCPASIRDVLTRALRPNKSDRFASAADFAAALRLCLNPRCWRLLQVPTTPVGSFLLRRPILSVVLAGLIPNMVVAAFNYTYNKIRLEEYVQAHAARLAATAEQIVPHTDPSLLIAAHREQVYQAFDIVQKWVNGTAFPVGISIGAWFAWKTLRMLRHDAPRSASVGSTQLLLFGRFVSRMLLVLWTISGVAFPLALAWLIPELRTMEFHVHFFVSLLLAGIAAIAYPFLLITAMVVRYFVPDQMRREVIVGPRKVDLLHVAWLNRFHLAMSALVPLLGVLLIVAFGSQQRWLLLGVSGGGLLGFAAMFLLERELDLDLQALRTVAVDERRNAQWIAQAEHHQRRRRDDPPAQ